MQSAGRTGVGCLSALSRNNIFLKAIEAEMEIELAREKAATAPEVTRATVITKQITELGRSEPDKVAATLRNWLQES